MVAEIEGLAKKIASLPGFIFPGLAPAIDIGFSRDVPWQGLWHAGEKKNLGSPRTART